MVTFRTDKVKPVWLIKMSRAYKGNGWPEQLAIILNEAITKCCILNQ